MKMLAVVVLSLGLGLAIPGPASAQTPDAGVAGRGLVESRAMEAMIWGMPAVNYDLMLQEMLSKTSAKVNEVVYWSRPVDWKNQTLTPNPDSIYLMTFFNTTDAGPMVIEVPPADAGGSLQGNIVNIWQMPLEDAGPEGADRGKGGKFLVLPPGSTGPVPDGYIVLRSDTYGGYALLRSNLASHADADVAKAVAYGKRIKVYSLAQAAAPAPTVFTDAANVLFDSTIRYDASFYERLDRIVQDEPWLARDRAMIDQLKSIGIEKGKPFAADANQRGILDVAAKKGQAWLAQRYDAGLPPFWTESRWTVPVLPELAQAAQNGYADPNVYPVDARGLTYTYGYIGIKRLGTAQFYLISIRDKDGQSFDGSSTYRLRVPPNVPVANYWSATAYDRETHALIRNMPRASRSSKVPDLKKNADGSIDLYFGPQPPAGNEANWVPTDVSRKFEVMFRLYGPQKELFDRTWRLTDIERVSASTVGQEMRR